MGSVRDFFQVEAGDCLQRLGATLEASTGATVNAPELLRIVRLLRGSAQLAREDQVLEVAQTLEGTIRALVSGVIAWDEVLRTNTIATLNDLRALVAAEDGEAGLAAHVASARERLQAPDAADAGARPAAPPDDGFRAFAAREISGIVDVLGEGIAALERAPRNREPLKAMLRRQLALLGSARLDELPSVADALRTVDDVCRLIARQDVAVEGEWLELFRVARAALSEFGSAEGARAAAASPALERLNRIRAALLETYGVIHESPVPQLPVGDDPPEDVVELFQGEAAVLLTRIERMAGDLGRATSDRQAVLRRELHGALTALRDTALSLGFTRSARMVEAALTRVGSNTAAEVIDLLPNLREMIECDEPVSRAGVERADPDPTAASHGGVVAIESLFYRGDALADRARELRAVIERALNGDDKACEALAELVDLIQQGLS